MAKKEDTDKKKAAAGTQGPEEPKAGTTEPEESATVDVDQGPKTTEIQTVEDLEILYPVLVSEIRDEIVAQIGKCPVQEAKKNLPGLYQRIVMDIQSKSGPNLNVPGFLLEADDPFAEATLRTWQRLKGIDGLRLPYVLPFRDKKTKDALENYILRANGGGDTKRAAAAREALKKI